MSLNDRAARADTSYVRGNGQVDSGTIDSAVGALLDQHPEAAVCAIGPDGVIVDMPDSVRSAGHDILQARSALDVVVAADRVVLITARERARAVGASRAPVRLASDPGRPVVVHFFDARETHGIYLGVFVAADGDDGALFDGDAPVVAPRFARTRTNELGVLLDVDAATTQILGWGVEEMVGHKTLEFIHPDDQDLAVDNWTHMLVSPGPGRRVRLRHRHRDGSWVWMDITNYNLLEDPDHSCVLAEMMDIADEMAALEALRGREQLLERLTETLPVGVLQVDALRRVIYTNERLHDIIGTPRATTLDEHLATVIDGDRPLADATFDAVLRDGVDDDIEIRIRPLGYDDVEVRQCTLKLRALTGDDGEVTGVIVCVSDVTESTRMRHELHMGADFDVLTGCHNRASTMAALEGLLAAPVDGSRPAVIFVDLDHFKLFNDQHGHAAGDEFLGVVAKRLHRAVREDDVVGRIGGDEFLAVCPGVSTAAEAVRTAVRIAESLSHEIQLKTIRTGSQASIGVAWSSGPDTDAATLVAQADAAMCESKRRTTGRPVLFTPSLLRTPTQPA
jgi:diguanylate cyclase (GGDEF)-like protein/PAS domain S-box-containing protein